MKKTSRGLFAVLPVVALLLTAQVASPSPRQVKEMAPPPPATSIPVYPDIDNVSMNDLGRGILHGASTNEVVRLSGSPSQTVGTCADGPVGIRLTPEPKSLLPGSAPVRSATLNGDLVEASK